MKRYAIPTALAGTLMCSAAMAGEPVMDKTPIAPPPTHDHDGCVNPGFSIDAGILYMKGQGDDVETDWDVAWRGNLRYTMNDGLFFEIRGFYHEADLDELFEDEFDDIDDFATGDFETWYLDFLIGDNIHNGSKFCVDFSAGVRYFNSEGDVKGRRGAFDGERPKISYDADGVGPVFRLEGTRQLAGNWSLYFDFTQAILFGDNDTDVRYTDGFKDSDSSDTVSFITEIGGGIQYTFGAGHIRVGGEGQYWALDGTDIGLYGVAAELGWSF